MTVVGPCASIWGCRPDGGMGTETRDIERGTILMFLGEPEVAGTLHPDRYIKVVTHDGTVGWVRKKFTEPVQTGEG
jgi:hypothetical protein